MLPHYHCPIILVSLTLLLSQPRQQNNDVTNGRQGDVWRSLQKQNWFPAVVTFIVVLLLVLALLTVASLQSTGEWSGMWLEGPPLSLFL